MSDFTYFFGAGFISILREAQEADFEFKAEEKEKGIRRIYLGRVMGKCMGWHSDVQGVYEFRLFLCDFWMTGDWWIWTKGKEIN